MRTIFTIFDDIIVESTVNNIANEIATKMGFNIESINYNSQVKLDNEIESKDGAIIIIGISNKKSIQLYLNWLRDVRIPYIFVKKGQDFNIEQIILPITNLIEEKEKGPFASSFARFFNCSIKIYQPNDLGSRAEKNIVAITALFDSFEIKYKKEKGGKDSNKIELEAILKELDGTNRLAIISASREYGLDDIIFGPKEKKIIKYATMPVMLINPRGDLYALCE